MTAVTYTARRSIIAGHAINVAYSIDLNVIDMPIDREPQVTIQRTLDGQEEAIRFHAVELYNVSLALHTAAQIAAIKEFLDSVEAKETFTFDPYGSANVPVSPLTATIDSGGYQLVRNPRGQGGANDDYRTTFRVRVLQT